MMATVVPNSTLPYCILPWMHLYVAPSGAAYPCCFGSMSRSVGDLHENTIEQIWDGDRMRTFRERMLRGLDNEHCARCHRAEAAGYRSFRQTVNEKFSHHASRSSGVSPEMHLAYLDFRFSNLCNFRCRTCNPDYSSAWNDDMRSLDPKYRGKESIRWGTWRDAVPHLNTAEEINFAGGEPLLARDHFEILRWLLERERFDVKLTYNTNLSVLDYKGVSFPEIWARFKSVRVSVSLDAGGIRGELLRKGKNWPDFEANLKRLWKYRDAIALGFTTTVSVFNVQATLDLIDYLRCEGYLHGDVHFDVNFLDGPSYYSVQILPKHMKERIQHVYERRMERDRSMGGHTGHLHDCLSGVIQHMLAADRSSEIPRFLEVTRRLDQIRGEDTFATFPELAELAQETFQ
jgi:radical SAM protein with 4Fe4S-binding SPASM domain